MWVHWNSLLYWSAKGNPNALVYSPNLVNICRGIRVVVAQTYTVRFETGRRSTRWVLLWQTYLNKVWFCWSFNQSRVETEVDVGFIKTRRRQAVTRLVYMYNPELFHFVSGSVTLDELMTGLMSAHETFQQAMDVEIREEVRENSKMDLSHTAGACEIRARMVFLWLLVRCGPLSPICSIARRQSL